MASTMERITRNCEIVEKAILGMSIEDIAKDYDINGRQVYNILKDNDYQEILEHIQKEQVLMLPKANKKLAEYINDTDKKISLDAIKLIQKNTGISPAHTQTVFINNLYQQNNNIIDAEALQVLSKYIQEPGQDNDVIDLLPDSVTEIDNSGAE